MIFKYKLKYKKLLFNFNNKIIKEITFNSNLFLD